MKIIRNKGSSLVITKNFKLYKIYKLEENI